MGRRGEGGLFAVGKALPSFVRKGKNFVKSWPLTCVALAFPRRVSLWLTVQREKGGTKGDKQAKKGGQAFPGDPREEKIVEPMSV